MLFALLSSLVVAAPPVPPALGEISAPLGHIGGLLGDGRQCRERNFETCGRVKNTADFLPNGIYWAPRDSFDKLFHSINVQTRIIGRDKPTGRRLLLIRGPGDTKPTQPIDHESSRLLWKIEEQPQCGTCLVVAQDVIGSSWWFVPGFLRGEISQERLKDDLFRIVPVPNLSDSVAQRLVKRW